MVDLQEIVRTTHGQGNPAPGFYVSVEDAWKLLEEIKRLQAIIAGAAAAIRGQGAVLYGWSGKDKQMGYYVGAEYTGPNIEDAWQKLGEKARGQ